MQLNLDVANTDRRIRIALGLVLLIASFLLVGVERRFELLATVPLLTAAVGLWPPYTMLGGHAWPAPKPIT